MKNSKFVIDRFAKLIEQGIVSSKDITSEILSILIKRLLLFLFNSMLTFLAYLIALFRRLLIQRVIKFFLPLK